MSRYYGNSKHFYITYILNVDSKKQEPFNWIKINTGTWAEHIYCYMIIIANRLTYHYCFVIILFLPFCDFMFNEFFLFIFPSCEFFTTVFYYVIFDRIALFTTYMYCSALCTMKIFIVINIPSKMYREKNKQFYVAFKKKKECNS